MKKEIKDQWVAALRSGEYKQGRGGLEFLGKYCCLGVLCDLAVRDGVTERYDLASEVSYGSEGDYLSEYLPPDVMNWAGMKSGEGYLPNPVGADCTCSDEFEDGLHHCPYAASLAEVNDDLGFTFNQIADLIDEIYRDL